MSSDVRKCVNLESESGGCATAPVCPTAGECEKSITCAEVEKEAEVRVVMAAGEMVGAKAVVEQETARAVVEKEAVATVVVARAAARAEEEERALEEESGEAGGGLSNSFPASAAISFQPRMLKKQHSEILLPGARRREFSHAGKDSAHLITRARFVKRNPKT